METENLTAKPKIWAKRLLFGIISLMAIAFAVKSIWTFSGSNRWELVGEKNGVKVYSWKTPGSPVKKFKGVVRVRSTLSGLLALASDRNIAKEMGSYDSHSLGGDEHLMYSSFRMDAYPPFPFRPRESVFSALLYQSPQTKEILIEVRATPDKTPANACCFRVTDMNNSWRFTPLDNGEIEVEWILNEDLGGFVPDVLKNRKWPKVMFNFLTIVRDRAGRYQAAKIPFIQEK